MLRWENKEQLFKKNHIANSIWITTEKLVILEKPVKELRHKWFLTKIHLFCLLLFEKSVNSVCNNRSILYHDIKTVYR